MCYNVINYKIKWNKKSKSIKIINMVKYIILKEGGEMIWRL